MSLPLYMLLTLVLSDNYLIESFFTGLHASGLF